MIVQIASDIHIEKVFPTKMVITDFIIPMERVEILILAGDIGSIYHEENLKHFFLSCKEHFPNVIFVPGNNEYYLREGFEKNSMKELNKILEIMCKESDILLLNNSYVELEEYIIFGSTWWSLIPENLNMRIFKDNGNQIDSDDFNIMHFQSRQCLNQVLEKKGNKNLVVVSHYCPTKFGTMNMHHKNNDFIDLIPYYFSSSEKYLKGLVDTWIFGHTHVFRDFYFDNGPTRVISNADPRKKFFRKNFCLEL